MIITQKDPSVILGFFVQSEGDGSFSHDRDSVAYRIVIEYITNNYVYFFHKRGIQHDQKTVPYIIIDMLS